MDDNDDANSVVIFVVVVVIDHDEADEDGVTAVLVDGELN